MIPVWVGILTLAILAGPAQSISGALWVTYITWWMFTGLVWLLPDLTRHTSPALVERYQRPVPLTRDALAAWYEFRGRDQADRIAVLERRLGRPHLGTLVQVVKRECPEMRDVLIVARRSDPDARYADYLHQRLNYLLFPRKIAFDYDGTLATEVLTGRHQGNRGYGAILVYGGKMPQAGAGRVVYAQAPGFAVLLPVRETGTK